MAKRKRGLSAKPIPDKIQNSPENIARALLTHLPKTQHEWEYLNQDEIIRPQGQSNRIKGSRS